MFLHISHVIYPPLCNVGPKILINRAYIDTHARCSLFNIYDGIW